MNTHEGGPDKDEKKRKGTARQKLNTQNGEVRLKVNILSGME